LVFFGKTNNEFAMKRIMRLLFLIGVITLAGCSSSRVSEISAHYEFNDCLIRYTLEGSEPASVTLYVTQDNNMTWVKILDGVSGDIGSRIEPGERVIIVRDFDEAQLANARFKLVIDEQFNFTVAIENLSSRDTSSLNTSYNSSNSSVRTPQQQIGFTEMSVTEEQVRDPPPPPPSVEQLKYNNAFSESKGSEDGLVGNVEVVTVGDGQERPVSFAQEMPQYPGGELQMQKDILENAPYPEMEEENNIQGKVYVQFIVEKDGSISNVRVQRGVEGGPNLSVVAENAVKQLKTFVPAKQNGRPVPLMMTIPVNFTLK
jgi:protein TonB